MQKFRLFKFDTQKTRLLESYVEIFSVYAWYVL